MTLDADDRDFALVEGGDALYVIDRGRQTRIVAVDPLDVSFEAGAGNAGGTVKAPMHGKLVALFVAEGDMVEKGQRVAIVEAMKMEHPVLAPRSGRWRDSPMRLAASSARARAS